MENRPPLPDTGCTSTSYSSPGKDSVDDFLNSLVNEDASSSTVHVPTNVESELQTTSYTHHTFTQMEPVVNFNCPESVYDFLDNLVNHNLTFTASTADQPDDVDTHPISSDTTQPSTNASTSAPSGRNLVNQGSQTDLCSLPSIKKPIHTGTNTTSVFIKEKCQQFSIVNQDINTSPHIKMVDCSNHLQGWDSPDSSPPPPPPPHTHTHTPYLDIPRYFISAYKERMAALNHPEEECPTFTIADEDPLPPHLSEKPVRW